MECRDGRGPRVDHKGVPRIASMRIDAPCKGTHEGAKHCIKWKVLLQWGYMQ